ncbi:Tenascin-N [Lucilia cuprina]|nr:Tenascin-N [Lucilia cuprina]
MFLKHLIIILPIICVSYVMAHTEDVYTSIFAQIENLKKSIEMLKLQENSVSEINSCSVVKQSIDDINTRLDTLINASKQDDNNCNLIKDEVDKQSKAANDKESFIKKTLFEIRFNKLPESKKKHCKEDHEPKDCESATKCTQKSGYYKISLSEEKKIMVFCDMNITGGSWMHILRRIDGSLDFERNWSTYLEGFGNVKSEYWIGLQNLYALTNNNGRQQLYVHLEDFEGETYYALYDNFVVGRANERFKLISLGNYSGTAIDGMSYSVGAKFYTLQDGRVIDGFACDTNGGGWWYKKCSNSSPTNSYFDKYSDNVGIIWGENENQQPYFFKTIYFMIRNF